MNTQQLENDRVKAAVQERYGQIAERGTCGCVTACCGCGTDGSGPTTENDVATIATGLGYSSKDVASAPVGSNLGLGCGNPQLIARLQPGETVLDLGSGAGFDAFLAARAVGPTGSVIGVDMTQQMISKARKNQATAGYENVEFRLGEIENLPVADSTVDVIISNCVINLSPDKERVFCESFRVLKPGGRLAISDVVAVAPIPDNFKAELELYTGCISGAAPVDELKAILKHAGFENIRVLPKSRSREIDPSFANQRVEDFVASASIEATKPGTNA